MIVTMQLLLPG